MTTKTKEEKVNVNQVSSSRFKAAVLAVGVLLAGAGILGMVGAASAAYSSDGVATYKNTDYSSVASVFGNGDEVYVSVMDWIQTVGGSRTISITNGTETISVNVYDDGTSPDTIPDDGHYWGMFTIGTGSTNDSSDYLHLDNETRATITADLSSDGTPGTGTILAYYTNPTKIVVNPKESIQSAIDSLPAEGGIVELVAGIHDVADTIVIDKSNVTIEGTHDSEIRFQGAAGKNFSRYLA